MDASCDARDVMTDGFGLGCALNVQRRARTRSHGGVSECLVVVVELASSCLAGNFFREKSQPYGAMTRVSLGMRVSLNGELYRARLDFHAITYQGDQPSVRNTNAMVILECP